MASIRTAEQSPQRDTSPGKGQITYMWTSSVPKLWKLVSDAPPRKIKGRFGHRDTLEFLCETQKYITKICRPIDLPPFYRLRKVESGRNTPATSRSGTRGRGKQRNECAFMRKSDSLQHFQGLAQNSSRQFAQQSRTASIPVLNLSFKGKKEPESAEAPTRSPFIQRYRGGGGFKAAPEYVIRHQLAARQPSREPTNWLSGLDH